MSEDKKPYRHITEEELKKYLQGELSGKAANDLERQALDSDFEGEALEGWESHQMDDLEQDMTLLRNKLAQKQSNRKVIWWQLAAVVVLLFVSGVVLWNLNDKLEKESDIAQKLENDPFAKSEESDILKIEKPVEKDQELSEEILQDERVRQMDTKPKARKKIIAPKMEVAPEEAQADQFLEENAEVIEEDIQLAETDVLEETVVEDLPIEEALDLDVEVTEGMKYSKLVFEPADSSIPQPKDLDDSEKPEILTVLATQGEAENGSETTVMPDSLEIDVNMALRGKVAGVVVTQNYPKTTARSTSLRSRTVTGVVRDAEGKATLPGVTVMVEGTTRGTVTDYDGRFELELQPEDSVISFHFIGMQDLEQPIASNMEVLMESDVESLSEVVVVGYGQEKSTFSTGSVTQVDMDDEGSSYQNAQPEGGMQAFKEYIEENIKYPEEAKANNIKGVVRLKLDISASGRISNIDVKKSLGYGCDEEAIRLVNEGPDWEPAQREGMSVESRITIRIRFK